MALHSDKTVDTTPIMGDSSTTDLASTSLSRADTESASTPATSIDSAESAIFSCPYCHRMNTKGRPNQEDVTLWTIADCERHCMLSLPCAGNYMPPNSPQLDVPITHEKQKKQTSPGFLTTLNTAASAPPFRICRHTQLKSCMKNEDAMDIDEGVCLKSVKFAAVDDTCPPSDRLLYRVPPLTSRAFRETGHHGEAKTYLVDQIYSSLQSKVVKAVITRRILSLEAAVGEEEMLARRLCAANTVANRSRAKRVQAQVYNMPFQSLSLKQRTRNLWALKKFEKRGRKVHFAPVVKVTQFDYDAVSEKERMRGVDRKDGESSGFVRYSLDDEGELDKVAEPAAAAGQTQARINPIQESCVVLENLRAGDAENRGDEATVRDRSRLPSRAADCLDKDISKAEMAKRWVAQFGDTRELPVKVRSRHCRVRHPALKRKPCRCQEPKVQNLADAAKVLAESAKRRDEVMEEVLRGVSEK